MTQADQLSGLRVLVIEDDYLVAEVVGEYLDEVSAVVVGPFGWRDEAIAYINSDDADFDIALLDINLHGQTSYPIADALIARGKLFVFTTGYGGGVLPQAYRNYPRCEKPFDSRTILASLASLA